MKTSGKRGVPPRGPSFSASPTSARPCCCLAMKRRSRSGARSPTPGRGAAATTVKTSGKRKGYKVFGLIDYFTGRFFYQGQEGRLNSTAYIAFLQRVLERTTQPILLIQMGEVSHQRRD